MGSIETVPEAPPASSVAPALAAKPSGASRLSIVSLAIAALISALIATPFGAQLCASCDGAASTRLAVLGTAVLAASLLLVWLAPLGSGAKLLAAAFLGATVGAHAGLVAARPQDACPLCLALLVEEGLGLFAFGAWLFRTTRAGAVRHAAAAAIVLSLLVGLAIGMRRLPLLLASAQLSEIPSQAEIQARLTRSGAAGDAFTLHLVLRDNCPRCRRYLETQHSRLVEALPAYVQLVIHQERVPGHFEPLAYPAFILTPKGSDDELDRLDGTIDADRILLVLQRVRSVGAPK